MSEGIELKDHLETSTNAAQRVRTTTIILAVATVLLFAGYINSIDSSWIRARTVKLEDPQSVYTKRILKKIDYEILSLSCKEPDISIEKTYCGDVEKYMIDANDEGITSFVQKKWEDLQTLSHGITVFSPVRSETDIAREEWRERSVETAWNWYGQNKDKACPAAIELKRLFDLRELKYRTFYEYFAKNAAENLYLVKIPFFNVAFDINDLSLVGGFGLLIIMILLRLGIRNYIIALKIGFKFALRSNQAADFYEVLGSRQLFVFPKFRDKDQTHYVGMTEHAWIKLKGSLWSFWLWLTNHAWMNVKRSIGGFWLRLKDSAAIFQSPLNKDEATGLASIKPGRKRLFERRFPYENQEVYDFERQYFKDFRKSFPRSWAAHRHKTLRFVSKVTYLLPVVVYFLIIQNDFTSREAGYALSGRRTDLLILANLVLWGLICMLAFWCVSKAIEVDYLWKYFEIKTAIKELSVQKKNINSISD
jgi:hypothetical protein